MYQPFLLQTPPPPTASPSPGGGGTAAGDGTTSSTGVPNQTPGTNQSPEGSGLLGLILPFALLIGFMWLFVLRPESKRRKEREAMISQVGKGSKVVTTGGIHGTVAAIDEQTVTLKINDDVRIKFDRNAIGRVVSSKETAAGSGAENSNKQKAAAG